MGIFKMIRHTDGGYDYLNHAVNYVVYGKANYDCVGSPNTSLDYPLEQMHYVKKYFDKTGGNPLFHFIVVYNTRTAYDVERAKSVTRMIADYFADKYQIIWCVHEKHMAKKYGGVSSMYHAHFVMNSVSYVDGRMLGGSRSEIYTFLDYVKRVTRDMSWMIEYGSDKDKAYEINSNDG